ncbi:hypothetical protein FEM48_Zijuj06G0001800 [Ziziphus jujuba var. spinosa]|uniref:BUB1 N-terminal domain-containing protein n=1 Tax=Ziziphus jujuba var. spinosa TaxID=714518 RepID=A0A978V618_ZIZJJ|nr:hypothetical protein FEM48_Zijuj06G0001800 [Ziziphus jujuba var. spinosa]
MELFDPETEFLVSKRETGNEWELFKENVRPLKRGRKIELLNSALKSHSHNLLGKQLIEAIDDYKGDDPLHPWIQCIKWVQEAFPPGGDSSGLVVIYEQCVRTFWHSDRYRDDLRYLKVWLEYAENCVDAQVIYSFLDANGIGKTHSQYYISYALHLESNNKLKLGNEILNLGISRNAQPIEKLKDAYRKFLARSMTRQNATAEDAMEKCLPVRSFGTVLARGENRTQTSQNSDMSKKNSKQDRGGYAAPFNIYKDSSVVDTAMLQQQDISETDLNSWLSLGGRAERNKENNAIPTKWTSYKIPQRPGPRTGGTSACIEVFVDEECEEEAELLRENPLRYFPPASLPR